MWWPFAHFSQVYPHTRLVVCILFLPLSPYFPQWELYFFLLLWNFYFFLSLLSRSLCLFSSPALLCLSITLFLSKNVVYTLKLLLKQKLQRTHKRYLKKYQLATKKQSHNRKNMRHVFANSHRERAVCTHICIVYVTRPHQVAVMHLQRYSSGLVLAPSCNAQRGPVLFRGLKLRLPPAPPKYVHHETTALCRYRVFYFLLVV